jgi:hypothetical protein
VPRVRREVVEFLETQGVIHYLNAIETGRQEFRPPGPPIMSAARLAAVERDRLLDADLWYVDTDMCDLLAASYPSMPVFAPVEQDLPSRYGFCVFAQPIDTHANPDAEADLAAILPPEAEADQEMQDLVRRITETPTRIVAASWGPFSDIMTARWPAGGCWVSFYGESFVRREQESHPILARAALSLPPMTPDNEAGFAWYPGSGDPARYHLPHENDRTGTWARMLFAVFRLATQGNLADTTTVERAPRAERRRAERKGIPDRDVRVVRLRPALREARDAAAPAGAGREYRSRWVVRGHWRNQAYGAGRQLRRPVWVAPYLKGPEGAPLLGGDRVNVIGR